MVGIMANFRSLISFWNETCTAIALLLFIGYFGIRGVFAFLPLAILTVFVVAGVSGCVWIAIQSSQPTDSNDEGTPWGDRALWFVVMFLCGTLGVTALGAVL